MMKFDCGFKLKTGMKVLYKCGEVGIVMLGTKHGDIFSGNKWCSIDSYESDLTLNNDEYTIMAIYESGVPTEMVKLCIVYSDNEIWKREGEPLEVSFTEAVTAYSNGKTIKCKFHGLTYTYELGNNGGKPCYEMEDDKGNGISANEILNGVWYIIQEEK